MTNLTAGEIAARIQEPGEDLRAITERLRSWTKEGLLKPVGKRKPGTGRHHQYPESAVVSAAILSKLSRHFGIWAPRLQHCDKALDHAVKYVDQWAKRWEDGEFIYLIIGVLYADEQAAIPSEILSEVQFVNIKSSRQKTTSTRHLPPAFQPHRLIGVPELLEFGIVINLTTLYRRLGVPSKDEARLAELAKRFPGIERIVT